MEKTKEIKKLSVAQRMRKAEALGAKVAIMFNKTLEKANKLMAPSGFKIRIEVQFEEIK